MQKTHSFNLDEGTWRDHLKQVGKLVNREKEADTYIQDYEEQSKRVKSLIGKELGNNEKSNGNSRYCKRITSI